MHAVDNFSPYRTGSGDYLGAGITQHRDDGGTFSPRAAGNKDAAICEFEIELTG